MKDSTDDYKGNWNSQKEQLDFIISVAEDKNNPANKEANDFLVKEVFKPYLRYISIAIGEWLLGLAWVSIVIFLIMYGKYFF